MDAQDNSISEQSPEVRKEGISYDKTALDKDFEDWWKERFTMQQSKVLPRAEANEDYRPLIKAAAEGDWEKIEEILQKDGAAMTAAVLTVDKKTSFTILDVAITAAQDRLVENLVKHFPPNREDLNLHRAFGHAVRGGRIRIVKALIHKVGPDFATIPSALKVALQVVPDQREVIWYLIRHLKFGVVFRPIIGLNMIQLIMTGHLDICLHLASRDKELMKCNPGGTYLEFLAILTRFFRSGARLNFWQKSIYNFIPLSLVDMRFADSKDMKMARVLALNQLKILLWNLVTTTAPFIKSIGESKLRHYCSLELAKLILTVTAETLTTSEILEYMLTSGVVLDAASRGVFEIVKLCLEHYPELMWDKSFVKQLMKEIVKGRHVELFRLVNAYKPLQIMDGSDSLETSVDIMEAMTEWSPRCVPRDVSGAAFLMQRELQWFQAVDVGSYHCFKWLKCQKDRKSYWEVFVEQRVDLVKEAGKWMKDTSSSCSVVATLIITIAFAAVFTVPEGNDNRTGNPMFPRSVLSTIYVVADVIALFCSVAATLMFLAILTSPYAIEDFHHSLPRRMVMGLTFLFLSLTFMLVMFSSALSIILSDRWKWTYILFTLLAGFPVVLFAILHLLPLYIEMVKSTYWPRLFGPRKLWK